MSGDADPQETERVEPAMHEPVIHEPVIHEAVIHEPAMREAAPQEIALQEIALQEIAKPGLGRGQAGIGETARNADLATGAVRWRAGGRFSDRFARWGSMGSAVVHGVALVGLAVGQPLMEWLWGPSLSTARSIQIVAQGPWRGPVSDDPALEYAIEVDRERERDSPTSRTKASPSDLSGKRPVEGGEEANEKRSSNQRESMDSVFSPEAIVRRRVDRAIDEAGEVGTEENLKRLDRLSGQLDQVATEQSVAELNDKLKRWLGTKPRATEPAKEPVAGPFDITTAQVHDVRREGEDAATYRYVAVLLDAEGRQMDQELETEDGEKLYRTFQLIKKNPLLEKVYRQVVMGLLDKLTQPAP